MRQAYDDLSPIVGVDRNFDVLNVPSDHISRSKSDTYYLNPDTVLRTHTSAHQIELIRQGINHFAVFGRVRVMQVMFTEEMKSIGITIQSSIKWKQWVFWVRRKR